MNDRVYSSSEIMTINANLTKIEFYLGHPVPVNLVDMSSLSDHILSTGEVQNVAANLHKLEAYRNSAKNPGIGGSIQTICKYLFFGFVIVYAIIDLFIK